MTGRLKMVKIWIRALLVFASPGPLARLLGNALGFRIAKGAKVGFSLVVVDQLEMEPGAYIGHFNRLSGPLIIIMASRAGIGHSNVITRAPLGVSVGESTLRLGVWAKITSRHRIDCTCSLTLGDYSVIAGNGCQVWTHGYVHERTGLDRYRIDGSVEIGHNVYIGSMCFIAAGVTIGSGIIVGGGSSIGKDLIEEGLYVSSPLRHLPRPKSPESRGDLSLVDRSLSIDTVYKKVPRA
jgi:acetyltransferase-like isoleucine patch superfamily enzyme